MLRLPPSEPPRLAEGAGPDPIPSKSAEQATSDLTGPLRISQQLPDQPPPNAAGFNLPSHRFGTYSVDPVPAASYIEREPEPVELDDSEVSDDQLADWQDIDEGDYG